MYIPFDLLGFDQSRCPAAIQSKRAQASGVLCWGTGRADCSFEERWGNPIKARIDVQESKRDLSPHRTGPFIGDRGKCLLDSVASVVSHVCLIAASVLFDSPDDIVYSRSASKSSFGVSPISF